MSVSTIDSTIPSENALNIVVIGASAGGVEALTALFRHIPEDICAAFLVVLHIPPHTPSFLHHILSKITSMRVLPAATGMSLKMKTVYVGVADRHIMLESTGIRVTRGPKECRARPAIDVLFRSAAQAYGGRVIGVILSGALDDGTAGLWAVKDRGGMAMVQTPSDAMHASMPESAIEHVMVDFAGSVESLAKEIARCVGTPVAAHAIPLPESLAIENRIAASGDGLTAGVMGLGKISWYTCPDCHGVLVQIEEGSVIRFRCHTGHAFSIKTLIAEINAAIDSGLWDTLRAIEERVMLLRQMATLAGQSGSPLEMQSCLRQANEAERRLNPLRELLLDANFFGHDPERS
nr:Chemotaxis response regulator protein-glutamate methylesterase of group 3 operon [Paraburkholderia busanensis]